MPSIPFAKPSFSFADIFQYLRVANDCDFFDLIATQVGLDGLGRLMQASRDARRWGSNYLQRDFLCLIDTFGLKEKTREDKFTPLMQKTGLILTGQSVLRFVLTLNITNVRLNHALNIHVHEVHRDRILRFLREHGYLPSGASDLVPLPSFSAISGLRRTIFFTRPITVNPKSPDVIQHINILLIDPRFSVTRPLVFQPSTAAMSYITQFGPHTLFPHLTFSKHAITTLHATPLLAPTAPLALRGHHAELKALKVDFRYGANRDSQTKSSCDFACPYVLTKSYRGAFSLPFYAPEREIPSHEARTDDVMAEYVNALFLSGRCLSLLCPHAV